METFTVQRKALRRASEIVGSVYRLSMVLEVSPEDLERWLAGIGAPPHQIFLRCVDIIVSHDGRLPWPSGELIAELPPEFRQPK